MSGFSDDCFLVAPVPDLPSPHWTFLTRHAQVLLCIADDPTMRLRDIGALVGITERAAHRIVGELIADGYLTRERRGRRNHYTLRPQLPPPPPRGPRRRRGPPPSPPIRASAPCSRCSRAARHRRDDVAAVGVERRVHGV